AYPGPIRAVVEDEHVVLLVAVEVAYEIFVVCGRRPGWQFDSWDDDRRDDIVGPPGPVERWRRRGRWRRSGRGEERGRRRRQRALPVNGQVMFVVNQRLAFPVAAEIAGNGVVKIMLQIRVERFFQVRVTHRAERIPVLVHAAIPGGVINLSLESGTTPKH